MYVTDQIDKTNDADGALHAAGSPRATTATDLRRRSEETRDEYDKRLVAAGCGMAGDRVTIPIDYTPRVDDDVAAVSSDAEATSSSDDVEPEVISGRRRPGRAQASAQDAEAELVHGLRGGL